MPLERSRYPENWESLRLQLKEQAKWTCQKCGKVCRKQGEPVSTFLNRCFVPSSPAWQDAKANPQRYCLTISHLDQNPGNNDNSNLLAMCCPCHLKYDHKFLLSNSLAKCERQGQLAFELKTT